MSWKIKTGFMALMAGLCISVNAQVKELPEFTKEGIVADYRLAADILMRQHPNPYKFTDSVTLVKKIDSLLKKAVAADNSFSAVQYSPVQLFRDVHTSINFSEDNTRGVISNIRFFPFPVVFERGKIFVNIKGSAIPYAAEVTSINGETVEQITGSLASSIYSDGFIETGTDRMYANFQLVFSMKYPYMKQYLITYVDPKSRAVKKINMASLPPAEGYHSMQQAVMPFNKLARAYWVFSDYDDATKTGVLTVNSFNLQEAYAYKEFSTFFKEANKRGVTNVVIDIRNNGGGNPAISALLYSFLADKAFRNEYNYRTRTIDMAYPEYVVAEQGRKFSDEDIRNNRNFLYQRFDRDSATGFYIGNARLREGQLENFPPDKDAFDGKVYVLTSGGTVSAATYFASLVNKNKRGMLVGKETGSGENVTTAAWFLKYMLPNTKSVLTVPMSELYFFNASKDSGRGVIPDLMVPLEKFGRYMQNGKDPEMAYVMELIEGTR